MNQQREVIYDLRLFALEGGEDLKGEVWEMIEHALNATVDEYVSEDVHPEEWELAALRNRLVLDYFLVVDELPSQQGDEHDFTAREQIAELVLQRVRDGFKRKLESFADHQERILSWVLLGVIDEKWRDHLYDLDHLKASIGFRGWGQKDPLIEYKQEAYSMFVDLMTDIRKTVASLSFRAQIQVPQPLPMPRKMVLSGPTDAPSTAPQRSLPAPEPVEEEEADAIAAAFSGARQVSRGPQARPPADDLSKLRTNRGEDGGVAQKPASTEPKVGRNDPCPCGSGKKYKKCHGVGVA
jgi:preprotein translocase subunit SecA